MEYLASLNWDVKECLHVDPIEGNSIPFASTEKNTSLSSYFCQTKKLIKIILYNNYMVFKVYCVVDNFKKFPSEYFLSVFGTIQRSRIVIFMGRILKG